MTLLTPVSPGEILLEEFMKPLGLSQNALARAMDVPPGRVNQIIKNTRAITADTALRLARLFSTTPDFWLNMQTHYDLRMAERSLLKIIAKRIKPIEMNAGYIPGETV